MNNSHESSFESSGGEKNSDKAQLQVDAYVALLNLLTDADAFVVAKAVEGLANADMVVAVDPLVHAVEKHPELAKSILTILSAHGNMRTKAIPHLREFCRHPTPQIRAAAVAVLAEAIGDNIQEELSAALADKES